MTRDERVDELKRFRRGIRDVLKSEILWTLKLYIEKGYLPRFDMMIETMLNKAGSFIDEHSDKEDALFWRIVLQEHEPSAICERTKKYLEKTDQHATQGQDDTQQALPLDEPIPTEPEPSDKPSQTEPDIENKETP